MDDYFMVIPKLKAIALEYLYDGMEVTENIYNYDGKVLLLAKDSVLTQNQINHLRRFNNFKRNMSVTEKTYTTLIARGMNLVSMESQEFIDGKVGYTPIKEKTDVLLERVKESEKITLHDTEDISSEVLLTLRSIDPSMIFQCINAPNPVDEYLRRHSVNVGFLNGLMGKWLGLSNEDIDLLVLSGLVHDVGKTKIPTQILDAPRRLSVSEFEVMKTHPVFSYNLLSDDRQFPECVRLAARQHHEKMNGKGYPDGIDITKISLFAKVTAVSDIYDAMVSKRVYKKANNPFKIISLLANKQFSELDISLVHLFTENMPRELIGKSVLLSDGSIGTIKYVVPCDLEHPFVDINGEVVMTNDKLHCVNLIYDERI